MAPPTLSSTLSPTLPRVPSPPPAARQPQVWLAEPLAGHWHGGDAFRTHLFNALSLMFPQGERSFIDTVREFLPHLAAEPHLRAQVLGFIGQEGTHARVHRGYNERLAELGFVDRLQARLERRIRLTRRWLRPLDRLAITVAYEHYTAVLAANLLANPAVLRGAHPQLALLWGWHAVEETEHKAVAFDVYRRCGGGYLRRLAAGLYASFFLALDLLVQVLGLLRDDRQRASPRAVLRSAWNVYFGPDRVAAALWRGFMHFVRPGFHPWQVDNRADVERWLHAHAQAFAASAPTLQPAPSAPS